MNRLRWILIGLLLIIIASGLYFGYTKNKKECVNPFELKDFTSGKERVLVCGDTIYRGNLAVVNKKEFPDLFQFLLNDKKDTKPDKVSQYVRVFEDNKKTYVSIKSVIDYESWNNNALGVFRKEKNSYKLVFKKSFKDNPGRWVDIVFGEDYISRNNVFSLNMHGIGMSISGDIGYLGCYGACRMLWADYYEWSSDKGTFVLANNKSPDQFKALLKGYQEYDNTKCQSESDVNEPISALYLTRKDKEKICSDDAIAPYTTSGQAAMLLKGIKAINFIIGGKNIGIGQVKDIKLD